MSSSHSIARELAGFAAFLLVVAASWLWRRRRMVASAKWIVYASGERRYDRTLLIVARDASPPEPRLVVVTGCESAEALVRYVQRNELIDRVLLWRAPSSEAPVSFLLIPGEAPAACASRLREALTVSAEEASRPPAVRPSQPSAEEASRRGAARERAANRDVAAAGPLLVIVIPAVLLLVFAVVDPLAPEETPKDPLARAVEQVCAEAAALCEAGNAVRRLVEAKDCEAARDEANRLAATFVRLPDATRTAALERALNVVHEHARECR